MKFFRSRLFGFLMAIVLACSGLMIWSASSDQPTVFARALGAVVTPVQNTLSGAVDSVKDFFGYFYRYAALEEENARLKAEVEGYRKMEQKYMVAINENTELRQLTGLVTKHSDFTFELCQVSSVYRGAAQVGMVLSKGTNAGIEQGDTVMTSGGLVGYVSAVGPNYSEVVTVLDIAFKAEAKISRTRETVIAEGDYELLQDGSFKLSYLPTDCNVQEGDLIETSGYAGIYPQGLILGRVRELGLDFSGLTKYAVVEPVDDITELRWVYVVKDFEVIE